MSNITDIYAYKHAVPYVVVDGVTYTDIFSVTCNPSIETKGGMAGFSVSNRLNEDRATWEALIGKIAYIMLDLNEDDRNGEVVAKDKVLYTITVDIPSDFDHQFINFSLEITSGVLSGKTLIIMDSTISGVNTVLEFLEIDDEEVDLDDLAAEDTVTIAAVDILLQSGVIHSLSNNTPLQIQLTGHADALDKHVLSRASTNTVLYTGKVYSTPEAAGLRITDEDDEPFILQDNVNGNFLIVKDTTQDEVMEAFADLTVLNNNAEETVFEFYGEKGDETWSCDYGEESPIYTDETPYYDAVREVWTDRSAIWTRQSGPYEVPTTTDGFTFKGHNVNFAPPYWLERYGNGFPKSWGELAFNVSQDHSADGWDSRILKTATILNAHLDLSFTVCAGRFNEEGKIRCNRHYAFNCTVWWIGDIANVALNGPLGPQKLFSVVIQQHAILWRNRNIPQYKDLSGDNKLRIPNVSNLFYTEELDAYYKGGHLLFTITPVSDIYDYMSNTWNAARHGVHWLIDYCKLYVEYTSGSAPESNLMIKTVANGSYYNTITCYEESTAPKTGTGIYSFLGSGVTIGDKVLICQPIKDIFTNALTYSEQAELSAIINDDEWIDAGAAIEEDGLTGYGLISAVKDVCSYIEFMDYSANTPVLNITSEDNIQDAKFTLSKSSFPFSDKSFEKSVDNTAVGYTICYYKYGETNAIPADGEHNGLTSIHGLVKTNILTNIEAEEAARKYSNAHKINDYEYTIKYKWLPKFIPRVGTKYNLTTLAYDSVTDEYAEQETVENVICRNVSMTYRRGIWSITMTLGTKSTSPHSKLGYAVGRNRRKMETSIAALSSGLRNLEASSLLLKSGGISNSHIRDIVFNAGSPIFTGTVGMDGNKLTDCTGLSSVDTDDIELVAAANLLFYTDTTDLMMELKHAESVIDVHGNIIDNVYVLQGQIDAALNIYSNSGYDLNLKSGNDIKFTKTDSSTVLWFDESTETWEFNTRHISDAVIDADCTISGVITNPLGEDLDFDGYDADNIRNIFGDAGYDMVVQPASTYDLRLRTSDNGGSIRFQAYITDDWYTTARVNNLALIIEDGKNLSFQKSGNSIDAIQDSGDAFSDVNDELMTAAAISNKIDADLAAFTPSVAISDLTDVDLTDIAANKILKYNSGTSKWECEDDATGGGGGIAVTDAYPLCHTSTNKGYTRFEYGTMSTYASTSTYHHFKQISNAYPAAMTNASAQDARHSLHLPLPTSIVADGVTYKLYIDLVGWYLNDADSGDYVNGIIVYGTLRDAWTSTQIDYYTTSSYSTGHYYGWHAGTGVDCSAYDDVYAELLVVATNAGDLDMTMPYVRFYYDST